MSESSSSLPPERRSALADKGKRLYAKDCGADGSGLCAEGFAAHMVRLGHFEVVHEYLVFLEVELARLAVTDPDRGSKTADLIHRIRRKLIDATV